MKTVMTKVELEQTQNALNLIFMNSIYESVKDKDEELIAYAPMLKAFQEEETFETGELLAYLVDENGFPMVYESLQTHIAQANILPNSENATNLYKLKGYYEGVRIWSRPAGNSSAYSLNQVVPREITEEKEAVTYERGATAYKDNYVISPDNLVYQVVPNQIVMNTDAVPFTETMVYTPVLNATVINSTTISITEFKWFKSKKNLNKFEPILGSEVWEVVDSPV